MTRKVVVALITSQQEFQQMQAEDARAAARRASVDLEIVYADGNAVQQIHQVYQFVHAPAAERPAAIAIESVSREGMERLARNAVRAGIGWINLQWRTDYMAALRSEHPQALVASVAVDEEGIGRLQARQFLALKPRGGAVLVVRGPQGSSAGDFRLSGLEQALVGSPLRVAGVLTGNWTADSARAAVASWARLRTSEGVPIDIVGAQNDSMAAGALAAMKELRRDRAGMAFTGCDGLPEGGKRMVAAGEIQATIVKPTTTGPAVELVARALAGGAVGPELILQPHSHPPIEDLKPRT